MKSSVSIVKCPTYEQKEVQKALHLSVDLIGGVDSFVKRGDRVLLKPNLLYGKGPEKAVTTHPAIVRGVIEMVKEQGGIPVVGDSPGMGHAVSVAHKSGIKEVADALGCPIVEFNRPALSSVRKGNFFKNIEIDQTVLEADVVINLPKWKTHAQMLLTLGVKNLFGCIPGPRKAMWHLKAGRDPLLFAKILVDVYQLIRPTLTILDGIVGMEGNGPNSGDPISLGLLLASPDPLSLDQIVCDLLGISRKSLWTNRVALEQGLGIEDLEVKGETIQDARVHRFKLPHLSRVDWYLPGFLKKGLLNALQARPEIVREKCKLCHQCVEICPPQALYNDSKGLKLNDRLCIRCFCCQEICPEGAISVQLGWVTRVIGKKTKV